MIDVVPLRFGVTFKKAFGRLDVFRQFVQDVLGITVNINKIEQEFSYQERIGRVRSEYDLFAQDDEQRIIIEIQHEKEGFFFDRFLYYHMISLIEQPKSFKNYYINQTVYSIIVLTAKPEDEKMNFSMAVSDMNPLIRDQHRLNEVVDVYQHQLVFLNPVAVSENTPEHVRPWLELIKDSLNEKIDETRYEKNPLFKQVLTDIRRDNVSPEQLEEILAETEWQRVKKHELEKGFKRGIEKGIEKEKQRIVINLLKEELDIAAISKITGLSEREISNIQHN